MNALIINCSPVRDGATAAIVGIIARQLSECFTVRSVCIDDYRFAFCKGCRSCHHTARCVKHDDVELLMREFEQADTIVCVSPSYWADVPGQFKTFIDQSALAFDKIHVSAGVRGTQLALSPQDLAKACAGEFVDLLLEG